MSTIDFTELMACKGTLYWLKQTFKHASVIYNLPHSHALIMHRKSEIVSLGVIQEDPASNDGVTKIMETLQGVCPDLDGHPLRISCNGDQMSVERMTPIKRGRCRSEKPRDRLAALADNVRKHAISVFSI